MKVKTKVPVYYRGKLRLPDDDAFDFNDKLEGWKAKVFQAVKQVRTKAKTSDQDPPLADT